MLGVNLKRGQSTKAICIRGLKKIEVKTKLGKQPCAKHRAAYHAVSMDTMKFLQPNKPVNSLAR